MKEIVAAVPRGDPRRHRADDRARRLPRRDGGRLRAPAGVRRRGALRPPRRLHVLARGGHALAGVRRPGRRPRSRPSARRSCRSVRTPSRWERAAKLVGTVPTCWSTAPARIPRSPGRAARPARRPRSTASSTCAAEPDSRRATSRASASSRSRATSSSASAPSLAAPHPPGARRRDRWRRRLLAAGAGHGRRARSPALVLWLVPFSRSGLAGALRRGHRSSGPGPPDGPSARARRQGSRGDRHRRGGRHDALGARRFR